MTKNILLLASKSQSRQQLLKEAKIPFFIIEQEADESQCDWALPLAQVVQSISRYKMEHAVLPAGQEGDICFVLTADTLSQDPDGTINGKPVDRADAIAMIKRAREGSYLLTAFCLDRKKFTHGAWEIEKRIERCVGADYIYNIPDLWIEKYIDALPVLNASNAIMVEEYGSQFLQKLNGSYTAIIGLPMFELREALEEIGFF